MPSDLDRWLAENTLRCEHLGSRIEPSFCRRYRQTNKSCAGCEQAKEMDKAADELLAGEAGEEILMDKKKICLECKDPKKKIIGRGLCGTCYHRLRAAGELDEKYPLAKPAATEKEQQAQPEPAGAMNEEPFKGEVEVTIPDESEQTKKAMEPSEVISEAATSTSITAEPTTDWLNIPDSVEISVMEPVTLFFGQRDEALLARLREWAEEERRTIEAQILTILDHVMALEEKGQLPSLR